MKQTVRWNTVEQNIKTGYTLTDAVCILQKQLNVNKRYARYLLGVIKYNVRYENIF